MTTKGFFSLCPSCGSNSITYDGVKEYTCPSCGLDFFHNTAAAVGIFLEKKKSGLFLFIRRARNPGKGLLDIPGGFVDPGESAEDALRREIREELDMELEDISYFVSYPNNYDYKGIIYATCDFFYRGVINDLPGSFDKSEIEELLFLDPCKVKEEECAFHSCANAVQRLLL